MMKKKEVLRLIQGAKDLAEEINWNDTRIEKTFEDDLVADLTALYKTLYAVNGFQAWEGREP